MEALIPDKMDDVDLMILTMIPSSRSIREMASVTFKGNASIHARLNRMEKLGFVSQNKLKHRSRYLTEKGRQYVVDNLGEEVLKNGPKKLRYNTKGSGSGSDVVKTHDVVSSGGVSPDTTSEQKAKYSSEGKSEGQGKEKTVSGISDGAKV